MTDEVEEAPLETVVTRSVTTPSAPAQDFVSPKLTNERVTLASSSATEAALQSSGSGAQEQTITAQDALLEQAVAAVVQDTPAQTEPAASLDLRQIAGNRVNMRQGPGTDFGIVAKLKEGQEVEVLQEPGNGWLKLRVISDDSVGWIADWLVTSAG